MTFTTLTRTIVVCLSLVLLPQAGSAQAQPLSLEETVALRGVSNARMSPVGDRIAYLLSIPRALYEDDDGQPYRELHVVDFDGNSRPYVSGEIDVTAMAWAPSGKSIFFVMKRDSEAKLNSLFEIPLDGGGAIERFTHVNSIGNIYPSPDGETLAFIASDAPPEKIESL
ncbi:MAG: hypothetical protein ACU85U_20010, partial [Gammaproteobacteria bacterium]